MKNWRKILGWILIAAGILILASVAPTVDVVSGLIPSVVIIIVGVVLKNKGKRYCDSCGARGYLIDEDKDSYEAETTYNEYSNSARTTVSARVTRTYECSHCKSQWSYSRREKV